MANVDNYNSTTWSLLAKKILRFSYDHLCSVEHIVEDLKKSVSNFERAINKLKFRSKDKLDMFILSLGKSEHREEIHKIEHILNQIVDVEDLTSTT